MCLFVVCLQLSRFDVSFFPINQSLSLRSTGTNDKSQDELNARTASELMQRLERIEHKLPGADRALLFVSLHFGMLLLCVLFVSLSLDL